MNGNPFGARQARIAAQAQIAETVEPRLGALESAGGSPLATLGTVADAAALRGKSAGVVGSSWKIRGRSGVYVWTAGDTQADNGYDVVGPSGGGAGRWIRAGDTVDDKAARVLDVLLRSKDKEVLITHTGTSISSYPQSPNRVFVEHLKALYGDSGSVEIRWGEVGGNYTDPQNGWKKQPFGGLLNARLRGESSSTPLSTSAYFFKQLVLEYSTELNGGSFDVQIDGVVVGTINCNGAQKYGNIATFDVPLGLHKVTLVPPASGFAYVERARLRKGLPGIASRDETRGGSALMNYIRLRGLDTNQVAGIPIEPWVGIDNLCDRADLDILMISHIVNDVGNQQANLYGFLNEWIPMVARIVDKTRSRNIPIIWIIEMAGHSALPVFRGSNPAATPDPWRRQQYEAMKAHLLEVGRTNPHVLVIDQDTLTRYPDPAKTAAEYYTATNVNVAQGTFDNDFIHPRVESKGNTIAIAALCSTLGLRMPVRYTEPQLEDDRLRTAGFSDLRPIRIAERGRSVTCTPLTMGFAARPTFGGLGTGGNPNLNVGAHMVPVYTGDITDYSKFGEVNLPAAGTSDEYGPYVQYSSQTNVVFNGRTPLAAGQRMTVVALVSGNGFIRPRTNQQLWNGPTNIGGDGTNANFDFPTPDYVRIEVSGPSDAFSMGLQGRFYGLWIVDTGGVAVVPRRAFKANRTLGPDALLVGAYDYDQNSLHQGFIETLGVNTVAKTLMGYAWAWDFATQAFSPTLKGCFRVAKADRTNARYLEGRIVEGTVSTVYNPWFGGYAEATTNSTKRHKWTGVVNISAGETVTVCVQKPSDDAVALRLYFRQASITRCLNPDGTWATTNTVVDLIPAGQLTGKAGETISITFALPASLVATFGTSTPDMYLEYNGTTSAVGYGIATFALGSNATV